MFKFAVLISLFVVAMAQKLPDPPKMPEMPKMPGPQLTRRVVRQAPGDAGFPSFPGQDQAPGGGGSGFPGVDPKQWLQKGQDVATKIADTVTNFGRSRRGV